MTYDVVVVGAGVVGASIAFQLASRGCTRVLVVERALPAEGSTAKATGGFRHQFESRISVELSKESIAVFANFEEIVGAPLDIKRTGYLFVSDDVQRAERMLRGLEIQRSLGVEATALTPEEVAALVPGIAVESLAAATYCADDGVASPVDACISFLNSARRLGVEVRSQTTVNCLVTVDDTVVGVDTSSGRISCGAVVLAAGVWTPALAETIGIALPIRPEHRQVFLGSGDVGIPQHIPFTIDLDTGAYFHRESTGLLMGGTDNGDLRGFDDRLDWSILSTLVDGVLRRLPSVGDLSIRSGWAGLREMTPDGLGLVGPVPSIQGLYVAAGFSGHGFMHSPAVGRIVADFVLGGSSGFPDADQLDPTRFDRPVEGLDHDGYIF